MTRSLRSFELLEQGPADDDHDVAHGVVNALFVAIPMWVVIGAAIALALQDGRLSEPVVLAIAIALVVEAVLARSVFGNRLTGFWRRLVGAANRP